MPGNQGKTRENHQPPQDAVHKTGEIHFPGKDTGRRTKRYDGLLFPPEQSFNKLTL